MSKNTPPPVAAWPWPDNTVYSVGCRVGQEPTQVYHADAKDHLDAISQVDAGVVGANPILVCIPGGKK